MTEPSTKRSASILEGRPFSKARSGEAMVNFGENYTTTVAEPGSIAKSLNAIST
jgi:hypothetical protein